MTAPVIATDDRAIVLDLSKGAELFGTPVAGLDVTELGRLIDRAMDEAATGFAFGRWAEPRELYTSDNFACEGSAETRTIHLGVDVFCKPGTPVCTPLGGQVVHLANNAAELDYGPVVIVRHGDAASEHFFTLYGHLSLDTLERLEIGQTVAAGDEIARVGEPPGNGNWPPHLHFQVIEDLLDRGAEFPGVAAASDQDYWLNLSPSPARYFPQADAAALEYVPCN